MTPAQEKVYYWSLISRARKVNKKIPDHWLKYGDIPKDRNSILHAHMNALADNTRGLFECDNFLYKYFKDMK